ncbi:SRPBCC family protein [Microbacterium lacticum]
MNHATGTAVIDAPVDSIREALLAATHLPEWNPAFVRVTGPARATPGATYDLDAIKGLRGTLTYTRAEPRAIAFTWQVPLLSETGTWQLNEHGPARTVVTHTVERHGALAIALAHTLGTLPLLRLDRLAERTGMSPVA